MRTYHEAQGKPTYLIAETVNVEANERVLSVLDAASVFEVGRYPRRPEAVAADPGEESGLGGAADDHAARVLARRGMRR